MAIIEIFTGFLGSKDLKGTEINFLLSEKKFSLIISKYCVF